MFRSRFAVALATALVALCLAPLRAQTADQITAPSKWLPTEDMPELVSGLENWLDTDADWPRRDAPPRIRFVNQWQAKARQGTTSSFQRGQLRALYDPDLSEILLVLPWDPRNAKDVSVLLHELVHHRQAPHHWYCPAAQELPAYRLQDAWLAEQGLAIEINWMAVVLDAGCSPRDIHPD
jgi:hypothetical protein